MIFDFIPAPKTIQEAAFQTRIMDRAKTLIADGYKLFFAVDVTGAHWCNVVTPEGATYQVDMDKKTCECPCFETNQFCKHLVAVILEDDRLHDEAMVAEYEARGY